MLKQILSAPLYLMRLLIQSSMLALGQIWVNKTRSILTTLGIIIGVASVSAVIAAMSGMNTKILENFEIFGTNKIFIWPEKPQTGAMKNANWWDIRFTQKQFENMLEHCPSVENVCLSSSAGTFTASKQNKFIESIQLNGVEKSWFDIENRSIIQGRPFSMLDESQARKVCIVTESFRDKLGLNIDCIGETVLFNHHTFLIIGVVDTKPNMMFDNSMSGERIEIYIPFKTSQKLNDDSWISVMASCKSPELAEDARAEIRFFLRKTRKIKPSEADTFRILLMENEVKQFMEVMGMISLVAFCVVSVSLVVGGVGIMNIMLVSVSERTREIGLRKAVGAKNFAILTQFLVEAVVLCLIGGLIGIVFGHLISMAISKSAPLMEETSIPAWAIMLSFGFSATVGIVFGMFPAIKAARLNPIEALRHE